MLLLTLLLNTLLLRSAQALDEGKKLLNQTLTIKRDSLLEVPLHELLLAPLSTEGGDATTTLDTRLQAVFTQCRELGVTSFMYETNVDTSGRALPSLDPEDIAYCYRLRYVRHQREHARSVRKELAAKHSAPGERPSVERRPAADVNFQEFFELYAEKGRPVVLELKEDEKDPVAQLLGLAGSSDDGEESHSTLDNFISICFGDKSSKNNGDQGIKMRPLRIEDESCTTLLESTFRVPIYMTHDYLQRTNASRNEAFVPAIIELPPAASDEDKLDVPANAIVSCPYGLHMLAIPLGDGVGTRLSLFNRKFEPIKLPVRMRELHEVVLAADANITRSRIPSTLFGDDFDGRDLEAVITGLQAETAYSFSVRLLVGEARGAVSGASRRVITSPCAPPTRIRGLPEAQVMEGTCLTLRWLDAEDDGGKNIELYLVSSKKLPGNGEGDDLSTGKGADNAAVIREHEKVVAVNASITSGQVILEKSSSGAPWVSTQVCGLLPGGVYTLRIAAMNVLGAGLWSHRSKRIKIPQQSRRKLSSIESGGSYQGVAVPVLKGVGDPGYIVVSGVDILSQNDLSTLIAQDPQRILRTSGAQIEDAMLPHVILSDVEEQVHVLSNNNSEEAMEVVRSFEVWASHHSPGLFDVSAELVLADPPDASEPLHNAHAVRDRVVLALRGGVPFVFKLHYAQLAGALGLVIADVNGSCTSGFDQSCVPGADKRRREGFAAQERHALWDQARIPCVLMLQDAAKDLLERLGFKY
ncbi:hypothetical protein JM18_008805 [Phytophthora kernoviae]|uniref:PA domain-containing protein n=1 Tax=Phytophthora kernoviae TaxID=325452 RepID=A0A921V3C1_9STRA|nr:hypothetical protein JM18_008805 [Phytophthora kernoviae]